MSKKEKGKFKSFLMRFSPEMYSKLEKAATKEHRSLTDQLRHIIDEYFKSKPR